MHIEFDAAKDEANKQKHGISLVAISNMDFELATVIEDERFAYGEVRYLAYAPIEGRLHVLYYTMRDETLRPIGLRKANARERKRYGR